jgi:hypothetical protein
MFCEFGMQIVKLQIIKQKRKKKKKKKKKKQTNKQTNKQLVRLRAQLIPTKP